MTPRSGPRPHLKDRWTILFLAGPVIWYLFFWAVYLMAEAACVSSLAFTEIAGVPAVSLITIGATLVAALVVVWFLFRTVRRLRDDDSPHQPLLFAGLILGVSFFISTVFVGLPAIAFGPC